jgi:Protein of unknown function (DUF550)
MTPTPSPSSPLPNGIFIEYYSHENADCYKILMPYTRWASEKRVLCPISEGLERAIQLARRSVQERIDEIWPAPTAPQGADPGQPAAGLDLEAIEARLAKNHCDCTNCNREDIPTLIAEVRRLAALFAPSQGPAVFDLHSHLARQADWSGRTFGPGSRAKGVVDHIRKELAEIEANPGDLKEWIDVAILALDGAWRSGASPSEIIAALVAKQAKNEARNWPDWRTADPNKAIEHDRSSDPAHPVPAAPAAPTERKS